MRYEAAFEQFEVGDNFEHGVYLFAGCHFARKMGVSPCSL